MSKLTQMVAQLVGRENDSEVVAWAKEFEELMKKGESLDIMPVLKALVDEDTGASVEISELATAVAERVVGVLADRGVETPDDIVEAIASEVVALFPEPSEEETMAVEDMPTGEEMKAWIEKSVQLVDDVLGVSEDVGTLIEAVEALAPLAEKVSAVEKALTNVERQLKARKPASQAHETVVDVDDVPEEVIEQLKAQIAAELHQTMEGRSKIVPASVYEQPAGS